MKDSHHNSHKPVSDELINAFIDHQITNEDRLELLSQIKQDDTLAGRICEMKQLKELTQHAFADIPSPHHIDEKTRSVFPRLAAAIAIFSLGLLLGIAGIYSNQQNTTGLQAIASEQAQTRVLVHLTSAEPESALNTLQNLQLLLEQYRHNQQQVMVEVVANGDAVQLLSRTSPAIADRIAELSGQYDNLSFAACKNTIDQMKITRGLKIDLLPQVKLIDSGVVQVIQRQRDGWTYIRG
jgi:intracellular sulfur oxidation DsrE/DsrF family protein